MPLLSDEQLAEDAAKRAGARLNTAGTKLNAEELATLEKHCRERNTTPGELIRQLILDELKRGKEPPQPDPLLAEIIGVRLLIANLLRPRKEGEKPLTPEAFDALASEIHRAKKGMAVKLQEESKKG